MSQDLIKRLEAATEGSRDLDAAIAVALLNIKAAPDAYFYTDENNTVIFPAEIAAYTSSIDAAVALAERVLPCKPTMGLMDAAFYALHARYPWKEHAKMLPIYLCIAILKAKEVKGE